MTTEKCSFTSIAEAAKKIKSPVKIGLVIPNESLLEDASLSEKQGIAVFTSFADQSNPQSMIDEAVLAVEKGELDTLAKGLVNTSQFLKAIINSKLPTGYLTHTSLLEFGADNQFLIVSDGTVTVSPTLLQKVEIVKNALLTARLVGISHPTVALISANELISPSMNSGIDAAVICKMAERGQIACESIEGPMALDTALSNERAREKGLSFRFEPPADIIIAPDLESGACLIKTAVHLGKARVAGILWGARQPIALTSRADSMWSKYISICLCALSIHMR